MNKAYLEIAYCEYTCHVLCVKCVHMMAIAMTELALFTVIIFSNNANFTSVLLSLGEHVQIELCTITSTPTYRVIVDVSAIIKLPCVF